MVKTKLKKTHKKIEKMIKKIYNKYGKDRIKLEPIILIKEPKGLNKFLMPDFIVYRTKEKKEPFLIVEVKLKFDEYIYGAMNNLRRYMKESGAPFGVMLTPKLNSIIQLIKIDGKEYEIKLLDLPDIDKPDIDKKIIKTRNIKSLEEFKFLLWETYNIFRYEIYTVDNVLKYIIQNLHRKLISEEIGKSLFLSKKIDQEIEEIDQVLSKKFEFYDKNLAPKDSKLTRTTIGVFQSFNLKDTKESIKKQIIEELTTRTRHSEDMLQSNTSPELAEFMVKLAGIKKNDTVLDPASGMGNILREVGSRGGKQHGIEINKEMLNFSAFFNDLVNQEIKLFNFDFLRPFTKKRKKLTPPKINHIILDPPMGQKLERDNQLLYIEEIFIKKSLELLNKNGNLIVNVPISTLYRGGRSRNFRKYILDNYHIDTIIEIESGLLYPRSSITSAIIKITKQKPKGKYSVNVAIIKSKEDIKLRLKDIIKSIDKGTIKKVKSTNLKNSFIPSKLLMEYNFTQDIKKKFKNVVKLEEIIDSLERGIHIRYENLSDKGLQFIQISDITGHSKKKYYVNKKDIKPKNIAHENDILLSIKGTIGKVYIPKNEIVPSSAFVIMRFKSKIEARVYAKFFESKLGQKQIEKLTTGSIIPFVSIKDLKLQIVPLFSLQKQKEIIENIERIESKKQNLLRKENDLKKETENLF